MIRIPQFIRPNRGVAVRNSIQPPRSSRSETRAQVVRVFARGAGVKISGEKVKKHAIFDRFRAKSASIWRDFSLFLLLQPDGCVCAPSRTDGGNAPEIKRLTPKCFTWNI